MWNYVRSIFVLVWRGFRTSSALFQRGRIKDSLNFNYQQWKQVKCVSINADTLCNILAANAQKCTFLSCQPNCILDFKKKEIINARMQNNRLLGGLHSSLHFFFFSSYRNVTWTAEGSCTQAAVAGCWRDLEAPRDGDGRIRGRSVRFPRGDRTLSPTAGRDVENGGKFKQNRYILHSLQLSLILFFICHLKPQLRSYFAAWM